MLLRANVTQAGTRREILAASRPARNVSAVTVSSRTAISVTTGVVMGRDDDRER
jgi:hypothetical protein